MEAGWCWRAAEARGKGMWAPEDLTACYAPCPKTTPRAGEVLDLVTLAKRQLRVGFSGAYALDWNVMARLADDAGVKTSPGWWLMVAAAEAEYVTALNPPKKPDGAEE